MSEPMRDLPTPPTTSPTPPSTPTAALPLATCRSCRATLDPILDLGALQLSGYLAPDEPDRPRWPLVLGVCSACQLVQLRHTAPREQLFRHYWYRSGVNEVMRAELHDIVDTACAMVRLTRDDVVLDIGANDGTLLARYPEAMSGRICRVAYEPAANLAALVRARAEVVLHGYFPDGYAQIQHLEHKVKIITAIAMVYAVEDLARFLAAIERLLHKDGVWIVQFQDLAEMLRATAFDNICHEHLTYLSLQSFSTLLTPYGLVVTYAERRAINGGSYRLFVQHAGRSVHPSVADLRMAEEGCHDWAALERFAWRVGEVKRQIRAAIDTRRALGQVIDLYGASTKANTLLQVCGLGEGEIRQAWERSPEKWGLRTAGSDIPIVSEEDGRAAPPDALLAGLWQFREMILQREADYLRRGGAFIFPLPNVDVVTVGRDSYVVG